MYNAPLNFRKLSIPNEVHRSKNELADAYRYWMYSISIAKNKKVAIGEILSILEAFTKHLKRVYLQVQQNWLWEENTSNLGMGPSGDDMHIIQPLHQVVAKVKFVFSDPKTPSNKIGSISIIIWRIINVALRTHKISLTKTHLVMHWCVFSFLI